RPHHRGRLLPLFTGQLFAGDLFVGHGHGHRGYRARRFRANSTGSAYFSRDTSIPGVHALLPAKFKRRIVPLAARAAVLAFTAFTVFTVSGVSAGLALAGPAGPARAASGGVSVAIGSMNPQWARPGSSVTVS